MFDLVAVVVLQYWMLYAVMIELDVEAICVELHLESRANVGYCQRIEEEHHIGLPPYPYPGLITGLGLNLERWKENEAGE